MDELKKTIAVADILLRKYGANQERVDRLTKAYGKDGAEEIQKEVNYCIKNDLEDRYLAIATIADHYGKGKDREKALGKWLTKSKLMNKTEIKNTKTDFRFYMMIVCAPTTPYNKK